jgi:hypothetical protein
MQSSGSLELHAELIDRLLECYCAWREECAEVHAAYRSFSCAPPPDRALAYAACVAALDREDAAAWMYMVYVSVVKSHIVGESRNDDRLLVTLMHRSSAGSPSSSVATRPS